LTDLNTDWNDQHSRNEENCAECENLDQEQALGSDSIDSNSPEDPDEIPKQNDSK
jgi:hypothetical protein